MTSGASVALTHDPAGRLKQHVTGGTAATRFVYSGGAIMTEMTAAGAMAKRHVSGPGTDELLVSQDGSGTTTRNFAFADERGAILALANSSGSVTGVDRYDEYGDAALSSTMPRAKSARAKYAYEVRAVSWRGGTIDSLSHG